MKKYPFAVSGPAHVLSEAGDADEADQQDAGDRVQQVFDVLGGLRLRRDPFGLNLSQSEVETNVTQVFGSIRRGIKPRRM